MPQPHDLDVQNAVASSPIAHLPALTHPTGRDLAPLPTLPSPSDFNAYARAVQQWPVLEEDEERRLARAWYHHHDRDAARRLVLAHLRLVVKIVRAHSGYNANPGDLVQEGNIGLMKAVKRFDPERGTRLASYATLWIEAEIRDYLINNWRMVKIGGTASLKKLFFGYRKTLASLLREGGHDGQVPITTLEIARRLGVDEDDVRTAESYFRGQDLGWDPDQETDTPNGHEAMENEIQEAAGWDMALHGRDPALDVEHRLDDERSYQALHQAMARLNERERAILTARRLTEPPVGLAELAEQWSVSKERVRQLENQAVDRLKKATLDILSTVPALAAPACMAK